MEHADLRALIAELVADFDARLGQPRGDVFAELYEERGRRIGLITYDKLVA